MEPAAPGTEDDIRSSLPLGPTKKESEQERLLSIKARLSTGKYGNVFELSFLNGSEHWYCNLCECPIMGRVYHHEIGKRHTNNMQNAGTCDPPPPTESEEIPLQIAPGEPVPPGFEDEMSKTAQIQERLDGFTVGPLIGLEYLFELPEYYRDKEPSYLCLLCDKRGDPRTVIAHLTSYNHLTQYMQRHFVTCFRALSPYITKQYKRSWQAAMQNIAEAIENKFGRLKPHVVDREIFDKNRLFYQNIVASGAHFNERTGLTFEELVNKEELTKPLQDDVTITKPSEDVAKRGYRKTGSNVLDDKKKSPSPPVVAKPKRIKYTTASEKRRSLSSVSSISSSDLDEFDPSAHPLSKNQKAKIESQKIKEKPIEQKKRSRSRTPCRSFRFIRKSRSRSPYKKFNRSLHPWQRSDYMRSRHETASVDRKKQKNDKLDEYKKLATAIENDMDKVLKQHEKNPEKHPQYNEEWKKFWNKRYKELQSEGKDASTYDFKPEWIEFWNKRMVELHSQDVKVKKDALRRRLGLPEEPAPICFRITGKKRPGQTEEKATKLPPMASVPDQDPDVIVIEDKDDDDSYTSKRSRSPSENDSARPSAPRLSRDKTRSRSLEKSYISRERSKDRSRKLTRSRSRSRDRSRRRSRERDYHRGRDRDYSRDKYYRESYRKGDLPDYIKPPRVMRDVTRHPVMSPPPTRHIPEAEREEDDTEVNIVAILRLLTALEEKLGSLGPKIIDLLGQALAMEKQEANSSETLLDSEINCVLFETVKEKLKGQLLAGLVSYAQEKAFKNAIKKTASLIFMAGIRKKQNEKELTKATPIKVPGVGTVDKAAIAKQIATALVLQGKTDVSQAELEQLINAVVGMAEASRNSNKVISTASFLEQINQPKLKSKEVEPPKESLTSALQATETQNSMEGLSDSDLQTLLQNFKDLSTDEQHSLISYLKKLEAKEPERVERLRKFVNLDTGSSLNKPKENIAEELGGRISPFSNRAAGTNPSVDDKKKEAEGIKNKKVLEIVDSDEEDYSYEDVCKAAKQNVEEQEEQDKENKLAMAKRNKNDDVDLTDAKSIIANIMGQLKNNNSDPSTNLGMKVGTKEEPVILPKSETIFPNLSNLPINIQNLTEALNSAQKALTTDLSTEIFFNKQGSITLPPNFPGINTIPFNRDPSINFNSSVERTNNFGFNSNFGPSMSMNSNYNPPLNPSFSQSRENRLNAGPTPHMSFDARPDIPNQHYPTKNFNYPSVSYPQQNPYSNQHYRQERCPPFRGPNTNQPRFDNYDNFEL